MAGGLSSSGRMWQELAEAQSPYFEGGSGSTKILGQGRTPIRSPDVFGPTIGARNIGLSKFLEMLEEPAQTFRPDQYKQLAGTYGADVEDIGRTLPQFQTAALLANQTRDEGLAGLFPQLALSGMKIAEMQSALRAEHQLQKEQKKGGGFLGGLLGSIPGVGPSLSALVGG